MQDTMQDKRRGAFRLSIKLGESRYRDLSVEVEADGERLIETLATVAEAVAVRLSRGDKPGDEAKFVEVRRAPVAEGRAWEDEAAESEDPGEDPGKDPGEDPAGDPGEDLPDLEVNAAPDDGERDPAGFRSAWTAQPRAASSDLGLRERLEGAPGVAKLPPAYRTGSVPDGISAWAGLARAWLVNLGVENVRQPRRVTLLLRAFAASGRDMLTALHAAGSLDGVLWRAGLLLPAEIRGGVDLEPWARKLAEHISQVSAASGVPYLSDTLLLLPNRRVTVAEERAIIDAIAIREEVPPGEAEGDNDEPGATARGASNRTSTLGVS